MSNGMPFANYPRSNGVVKKLENSKLNQLINGTVMQKLKKVYTPNVNAIRHKNKDKEIAQKTIEKNKRIIASRNDSRKPRVEGRFIQSPGLFSDGAGEIKRTIRYYNGDIDRQNNGRVSAGDNMHRPKIEIHNRKVDKSLEASVLNNLLDCDDFNPLDSLSRDYEPIVLPLSANNKPFLDIFCANPKFKQDNISEEKETAHEKSCASILFDTEEILHEAPNFLSSGKYTDADLFISLIRLPDSFPAKGFSDSKSAASSSSNTGEKGPSEETVCVDFNSRMFDEGQLGRIIVRQSGKIEILIGQGSYLLQSSGEPTCNEEAMIVPNNSEDSTEETEIHSKDEIIVLGDIKEHLTLTPSWQQLFLDKMTKKMKHFGYHAS